MKVSKVNHIHSGVSVKNSQPEGVLYHSPKQIGVPNKSISDHVKDTAKTAQKLYKLFGEKNPMDAAQKDAYSQVSGYMGDLIDELKKVSRPKNTLEENVKIQISFLEDLENQKIFKKGKVKGYSVTEIPIDWNGTSREEIANCLAYGALRRSMCRTVPAPDGGDPVFLPEVVRKLVLAVSSGRKFAEQYGRIPEREVRAFLSALNEDYFKNKQIGGIVRSIENQNVRVQCVMEDGEYRLRPASASNPKKKYLFDFLKEYASCDAEGRDQMVIHFRQLVLLYYCGHETYQKSLEGVIGAWTFGSLLEAQGLFSEKAAELCGQMKEYKKDPEYKKTVLDIKQELRKTVADHYRSSIEEEGLTDADRFWLQYIENQAERLLSHADRLDQMRLSKAYLCKKTSQEWVSYVGMKYVDMGKAVYHFAMPDGDEMLTAARFGEVRADYTNGISSFDYEHIKARESLNQELFSAISFAVSAFDRAARATEERGISGKEDILQILDSPRLQVRKDADARLLQFFGGKGNWIGEDGSLKENLKTQMTLQNETDGLCDAGKQMTVALGKELNQIRNFTFHYVGGWAEEISEKDAGSRNIIRAMFEQEYANVSYLYRKKYYADNVLMFYPQDKIDNLIAKLYEKPVKHPAQIPAFSRILNKALLKEFKFVDPEEEKKLWRSENDQSSVVEKYQNALLFLLKEIYYYGFLQDKDLEEKFIKALDNQKGNPEATKNLKNRISEIESRSSNDFGKLCQSIMTDYNLQNKGMRKMSSKSAARKKPRIYEHFRELLYLGIRDAFLDWLKENSEMFGFLSTPRYRKDWAESISEKDFCGDKADVQVYSNIPTIMENDRSVLYSWYVMAHFLNQRQLNFLIGEFKNYITFTEDIDKRTSIAGSHTHEAKQTDSEKKQYEKVILILDFSKLFCEQITNNLEDYFEDEEAYGEYLSSYVAWEDAGYYSLKDFCMQELKENGQHPMLGIYYDGQNPIVNRNVVLSRMYGNEDLLTACMKEARITEEEILEWYGLEAKLRGASGKGRDVFKEGFCVSEKEQTNVRDYQNQKNRIELIDLMFYSEMVNDLMSQLRKWCYLRERDLMYCQLGIHYIGLYYGNEGKSESDQWLDRLERPSFPIEKGAVLYQIAAMYTYGLPVYGLGEDGKATLKKDNARSSTGRKVMDFLNEYCHCNEDIYYAGLNLFEDLRDHQNLTNFRNSIDHFKFENNLSCSILSLYGIMFDSFLRYDTRLQKSVPIILQNILLKHFIISKFDFDTETEDVGRKTDGRKATTTIRFREGKDSVSSDILTYKLQSESEDKRNTKKRQKFQPAALNLSRW